MSWYELIAVSFGVLYLLLAIRELALCWLAGFFSTAIFCIICFQHHLYMDAVLQAYYVIMSLVGWWQWHYGSDQHDQLAISVRAKEEHAVIVLLIFALSAFSGNILLHYTDASFPFLDSILAWGGIITTILVTRKVLENWLYWIVLDALSVYLYVNKGLYLTAGLCVVYTLLAIRGFMIWRLRYLDSSQFIGKMMC